MHPDSERRVQTVCLLVISAVMIAFSLYWLQPVLVPFILALFIAIGLKPLVNMQMTHLKLPRGVSVVSTLLLSIVVLFLIGLLVTFSVHDLLGNVARYEDGVANLIEKGTEMIPEKAMPSPEVFQRDLQTFARSALRKVAAFAANTLILLVSNGVLVAVFLCFLLFGCSGRDLKAIDDESVRDEIESKTRYYILTKTAISVITGLCVGLVLWMLGVEAVIVFALLTVLLNFIPSIGSFIATLLPLPLVLLDPTCTFTKLVLVLIIPMTIQTIIGNIIEPQVMGRNLRLHPITLLLALIFWGALWGIVGMFLAVPLTAMLRILFEKSELTRPVADVMGGQLSRDQSVS